MLAYVNVNNVNVYICIYIYIHTYIYYIYVCVPESLNVEENKHDGEGYSMTYSM